MDRPEIYVGTSGYSYPEWKGLFYPPDLPSKAYLRFYSERFPTTEINNTFYRLPSESTTAAWSEQVPPSFHFSLKLTQKITHQKKLADVESEMVRFREGIQPLAGQLAAVLVQLPPYFRKDLGLLSDFLGNYGRFFPMAFEFRHASWQGDDVYQLLSDNKAALVAAEMDETAAVRQETGSFVYVRLRKSGYAEGELESWAEWIRTRPSNSYVYLKHDAQAPLLASQLSELLETGARKEPVIGRQQT